MYRKHWGITSLFLVLLGLLAGYMYLGCSKTAITGTEMAQVLENGQGGLESPSALVYTEDEAVLGALASGAAAEALELTYQVYRIRQGDMIEPLAAQFGITQDTLISVNNIKATRLIQPDQYLKVPSIAGILYTVRKNGETIEDIAKQYEISPEKCAEVNHLATTVSLTAGATLFVPDAELDWVTRQEINGDLFLWPLKGRRYISSPYAWRRSPFTGARSFHNGLDIPAPEGTSIYAAFDGSVTSVGYNETYGNYIILSHRSGYQTLYGHLSRVLVEKGQYVWTTTVIGRVGNTGQSTGPHLHFTVYKNYKTINPRGLLP
jgi:murein DD-endopeptidase MepM/ murein hydrolase activator NlpD